MSPRSKLWIRVGAMLALSTPGVARKQDAVPRVGAPEQALDPRLSAWVREQLEEAARRRPDASTTAPEETPRRLLAELYRETDLASLSPWQKRQLAGFAGRWNLRPDGDREDDREERR